MDEACFESALKSLTKTQHKRRFMQILLAIREGVSGPDRARKLYKAGSLKYIASCLQQDSKSVIDVALSILGNCSCLDVNCAKSLVQHHKILPALCELLEKFNEDSVRGRVFRIVGNLSDVTLSSHILDKQPTIITKTVEFINDDAAKSEVGLGSESTLIMALRIIRKFLTKNTLNLLLTKFDVLKAIGRSLIKYTNLWETSRKYEEIVNELVKTLLVYSNHKHTLCVSQVKNTPSGDALLCLSKIILKFPERVIKITINFYKTCSLKSDIPIEEITRKLMDGIDKSKNEKDGTVDIQYLKALCKICDQVGCRDQIKSVNVIPYLVDILKGLQPGEPKTFEHYHSILSCIIMCKYDYSLVSAQVKSGIINILTETLQAMYGKSNIFRIKHKCKKRQPSWKQRSNNKKLKKSYETIESELSMDWSLVYNSKEVRSERSASPSSSSDDMSSSPNSPRYPIFVDGDDLSDSDNYSPICSDNEETEANEDLSQEDISNPSEKESEANEHIKELSRNKNSVHFMVKQEIHSLLKWYTTVKPTIVELTNPNLICALTKAATDLKDSFHTSFNLLLNILSIPECLLPLMTTEYIPAIYSLTINEHDEECVYCSQLEDKAKMILSKLKKLAESGGGRGEIAHILLRSRDNEKKERIALAIPYIIGNKSILRNLLVNCEGIDIILNILKSNEKDQELCVRGICEIATTQLKIKNPKVKENEKTVINYQEQTFSLPTSCKNIVTFKLDDGSLVKADRDFLSENCDYFNRLLSGHFKESQENIIYLPNVNVKALHLILVLMKEGISKQLYKFNELQLVLEAIALADQFILLELSGYLAECVEQTHLSLNTVHEIYQWSVESGTNFLRVECIAFALVEEVSSTERYYMFQKLLALGYPDILADDIKTLLTQFLGQCS